MMGLFLVPLWERASLRLSERVLERVLEPVSEQVSLLLPQLFSGAWVWS
jgi:hypothetical protein